MLRPQFLRGHFIPFVTMTALCSYKPLAHIWRTRDKNIWKGTGLFSIPLNALFRSYKCCWPSCPFTRKKFTISNSCYAEVSHIIFSSLLTLFIGPRIVIYSYSTPNKMHLLPQIIYSCKTFYMFRTVFPSVIRSSKLRIQQRYMSNGRC
jgi:hypothetical protein